MVADLGPQIVTALTGFLSFFAGVTIEVVRHRIQRQDRLHDELVSIYGRYVGAVRRYATDLSGMLYGVEPAREILARARQDEELVGPVRIYANDEVRRVLDELSPAYEDFSAKVLELFKAGLSPSAAVGQAWGSEMRSTVDRLEDAMRRHIGPQTHAKKLGFRSRST